MKALEKLAPPEALSDLLLKLAGRDECYPAYPESRNAQREQVDALRASQLACLHHNLQVDAVNFLRRREIALMLENASLTPRQREVVELFLHGYTFEEIGQQWGISKQAAHKLFLRACEAIRRSWMRSPLYGLTLTYHESTLRHYARRTRWLNRDEETE
ncbi:MAG: sigma factor-like helix-turn-helix DNA-binding protein [Armatimonadota bacterium]|nr:hypothetical protein [bacterium]MDW8320446.1 sigma factor-like helix-turn-helix DNA-binding protein [Armatimonadota bacterium]